MPNAELATVAERLVLAMKRAKLRNPDVAEALGVATGTVSNWRNGHYPPDQARIPQLATLLGVSPAWLMYGGENSARREREARMVREPVGIAEPGAAYDAEPSATREAVAYAAGQFAAIERIASELVAIAAEARQRLAPHDATRQRILDEGTDVLHRLHGRGTTEEASGQGA